MTLSHSQENALLSILDNGRFLTQVAGTTKMARKYYNQDKFWCSNISLVSVEGFHKTLRLVLNRDTGCVNNKIIVSNLNNIIKYGPVSKEEAVFYYYYKHHDFFIDILSSLKQAFQSYSERRFYCKNIRLPSSFDWPGLPTHKDRNFIVSGEDIMRLFGTRHFVDTPIMDKTVISHSNFKPIKLPRPIHLNSLKCRGSPYIPNVGNFIFRNDVMNDRINYPQTPSFKPFKPFKPFKMDNSTIVTAVNLYTDGDINEQLAISRYGQILNWDTSGVTSMTYLFSNKKTFNQPLNWDVSSVTDMSFMFAGASAFNQPLNWNVSSVNNMSYMFIGASVFNQPLNWNVSSVTIMMGMFVRASLFNQLLNWNVSSVTNMSSMFHEAIAFNQPLNWNVSSVTNMSSMFLCASNFNQDLSEWSINPIVKSTNIICNSKITIDQLPSILKDIDISCNIVCR